MVDRDPRLILRPAWQQPGIYDAAAEIACDRLDDRIGDSDPHPPR